MQLENQSVDSQQEMLSGLGHMVYVRIFLMHNIAWPLKSILKLQERYSKIICCMYSRVSPQSDQTYSMTQTKSKRCLYNYLTIRLVYFAKWAFLIGYYIV